MQFPQPLHTEPRPPGSGCGVKRATSSTKALIAFLALFSCAANWTDRNEYDLVLAIRSEVSAQKKLALLDQWKAKYPATALRQARRELYLDSYRAVGDSARMLDVAREMLAEQRDSFVGAYWCTVLVPASSTASPEIWSVAAQAARQLLSGLDGYFEASKKPPPLDAAEWQNRKAATALMARRTLGWVQWQRGQYAEAESEFSEYLRQDPNSAEISAWLGTVLALQKQPEKVSVALWHLARASSGRDGSGIPDSFRRQTSSMLENLYASYHGGSDGLEELRAASIKSPMPSDGFAVESAAAATARREEEMLARTNPELAAWRKLRKRLEAQDGAAYFDAELRGKLLPSKLKGMLSRFSPAAKPSELLLCIENPAVEEVVVKLASPFPNVAPPGQVLEVEGIAESFTREPFVVVIRAEREKVVGWPGPQR